jgi:hypothetical protein
MNFIGNKEEINRIYDPRLEPLCVPLDVVLDAVLSDDFKCE